MTFISVTASPCNVQGATNPQTPQATIKIHKDLIGAINGQELYLKGGNILSVGGHHYTNFRQAPGVNLDNV